MPKPPATADDLPADNAARLAIYDALADAPPVEESGTPALTEDELFSRVVGRLRILVPRELHVLGEREYVRDKISACVEGGIVAPVPSVPGLLALTGTPPQIRYPDGEIRDYEAGLEAARERLEADDAKLRQRGVDLLGLVPSLADDPESGEFRALVTSMREHGYLKQFPPAEGADGIVVDGRARIAAAALANVRVETAKDPIPRRRDTPLYRALLALDANRGRLSEEQRQRVYAEIAAQAGRSWGTIAADLERTRAWRRATPRGYTPTFEVRKVRYRPGGVPNVQVTPDGRVMLRSLLEAAGLSNYKIKDLRGYVLEEKAKTVLSEAGSSASRRGPVQPAIFVRIVDAIPAIENMQRDRQLKNRLVEKEWEDIRKWLVDHSSGGRHNRSAEPPSPPPTADSGSAQQQLV